MAAFKVAHVRPEYFVSGWGSGPSCVTADMQNKGSWRKKWRPGKVALDRHRFAVSKDARALMIE
jgi:hypothetical protein